MLSKDERQRLHEIERQFADENPQYVDQFAKVRKAKRPHHYLAWAVFVVSMVVMTSAAGLYGTITVLVATFFAIALAPVWKRHAASEKQASQHDPDHRSFY